MQEQENPTDIKTRAVRETCGIPNAGKGEVVQGRPSIRLSHRLHKKLASQAGFYQVKLRSFWVFFCIRSLARPSPAAWTAGNDGHVLGRGKESGTIPASRWICSPPRAGAEPPGRSRGEQAPVSPQNQNTSRKRHFPVHILVADSPGLFKHFTPMNAPGP